MLQPKYLEELVKKVTADIPEGFGAMPEGLKQQVKSWLTQALAEMDFVTREEFDQQKQVLQKTRQLVKVLEQRVAELEAKQD